MLNQMSDRAILGHHRATLGNTPSISGSRSKTSDTPHACQVFDVMLLGHVGTSDQTSRQHSSATLRIRRRPSDQPGYTHSTTRRPGSDPSRIRVWYCSNSLNDVVLMVSCMHVASHEEQPISNPFFHHFSPFFTTFPTIYPTIQST